MGIAAIRLLVLFCVFVIPSSSLAQAIPRVLITKPVDESQLTVLKGNTHPLARAEFDQGVAPMDLPMNRMLLVLKRSDEQEFALRSLIDAQQDKASPNYHKWLTPEAFGKQFGPPDQDIQQVTTWLQSHGFQIAQGSKGRTFIEFSGTAAQVQEALHTTIHKYAVKGEEHWANSSDPQIPAALTPVVAGVLTLHNFLKMPTGIFSSKPVPIPQRGASPLTTGNGHHFLVPGDYATIYSINPLYSSRINGQGVKIAVIGRSSFNFFDLSDFHNAVGLPTPVIKFIDDGADPGNLGGGEEAEAILDTTWSGAIAPNAEVDFIASASTNTTDGVDLSELYAVDNNVGDVMTESFGACEAAVTSAEAAAISSLAAQAAAQGITYMVSTGDAGAEGCDDPNFETVAQGPISVNVLASTPFNVAVGGTVFNENGNDSTYWNATNDPTTLASAKSYIPEDVWNESCITCQFPNIAAGSGGASVFFGKPSFQAGVSGIPGDNARDLPDISLTAAGHDPYLICFELSCEQGYFAGIAGTSGSAPSFAGMMALVVQQYGRQGQADYVLYRLAAAEALSQCNASNTTTAPASTCVFNDVTLGNNAVPGEQGYGTSTAQYQAGTGYDLATGLGSVNASNLVNKWNTVTFTPTTTTLSLSPTSITHGQAINFSVTVSGKGGVPSGPVSLITSWGQSIGPFALDSSGSFSGSVHTLPSGFYTVTAQYGGDGIFAASSSAPSPQLGVAEENSVTTVSIFTINGRGSFVPFTSGPYGSFVYVRADVAAQSGYGTPSGGPNFLIDNGVNQNDGVYRTLNSLGYWTLGGIYSVGSHAIQAEYDGQGFFPSTSPSVNVSITTAPTTTTVSASAASQGTNLTVTVGTNGGGTPPTGVPTFFVDGNPLAGYSGFALSPVYAVVNSQVGILQPAAATVTLSGVALANGQHTITAQYGGDTNYGGSSSAPVVVNLQPDFSLNESGSTVVIPSPGQSGTLTLTVGANNGFSGAVNFSCAGLPSEATCSAPAVTTSGTTTLTVSTTASHTVASRAANVGFWTSTVGLSFGVFVLLGIRGRRRQQIGLRSIFLLVCLIVGIGCGGGSNSNNVVQTDPGTPIGSYNVTVTATSGTLSHAVPFTLVVQ